MKFVSTLSLLIGLGGAVLHLPEAQAQKAEVSKADKAKSKKAVTAAEKSAKAGDYEKALASYQEAYSLEPLPEHQASIGDCYTQLTRYKEALAAYNKFLAEAGFGHPRRAEVEKKIPETKLSIANAAKSKADTLFASDKDLDSALALYKEAMEYSQDPIYFYKMGLTYEKQKKNKDGLDAFSSFLQKAPQADSNRADAEKRLWSLQQSSADAAFAGGQYEDAANLYRMLYSKDADPKRLAEIGKCYQKMGKTDEANTNFRSYLEKADPNDPLRPEIEALLPKATTTPPPTKGNKRGDKKDPASTEATAKKSSAPKIFLGLAGVSAVGAGVTGFLAFSATQQLNELTTPASAADVDPDAIALQQAKRAMFAPMSDAFLGAAVLTGVIGIVSAAGNKPDKAAQLQVGPTNIALSVKF